MSVYLQVQLCVGSLHSLHVAPEQLHTSTRAGGSVFSGKVDGDVSVAILPHGPGAISTFQSHFSSLHANVDQESPKGTEHKLVSLKGRKSFPTINEVPRERNACFVSTSLERAKKPNNEGEFVKNASVTLKRKGQAEASGVRSRHTGEHSMWDRNTTTGRGHCIIHREPLTSKPLKS